LKNNFKRSDRDENLKKYFFEIIFEKLKTFFKNVFREILKKFFEILKKFFSKNQKPIRFLYMFLEIEKLFLKNRRHRERPKKSEKF